MIDGLNNKMLFGALANLRLAPHVREGAQPGPARAAGSVVPAAPTDTVGVAPSPPAAAPRSTTEATEKLSLSPQALAAYERASAGAPPAPPTPSPVDAPADAEPIPSTLRRAASAYAEHDATAPADPVRVASRPGALYA